MGGITSHFFTKVETDMQSQLTNKHRVFINKLMTLYESGEHFITEVDYHFLYDFHTSRINIYSSTMQSRLNDIRSQYIKHTNKFIPQDDMFSKQIRISPQSIGGSMTHEILHRIQTRTSPGILSQEQHIRLRRY